MFVFVSFLKIERSLYRCFGIIVRYVDSSYNVVYSFKVNLICDGLFNIRLGVCMLGCYGEKFFF